VNHQVAAIGNGQALDLVEAAECERGRYQAGDNVPRWRSRRSRHPCYLLAQALLIRPETAVKKRRTWLRRSADDR
jgi:hypothetical protein